MSSRSSSRRSSRSSSKHSSPDHSPQRDESRRQQQQQEPSVAPAAVQSQAGDALDEDAQLLACIQNGNSAAFSSTIEHAGADRGADLLRRNYEFQQKTGNLLFHACGLNRASMAKAIARAQPQVFAEQAPAVFAALMRGKRFPMARQMLLLSPQLAAVVLDDKTGDVALHWVCRRKQPDAKLIATLLAAKCAQHADVNGRNAEGRTALHHVCLFSNGVAGREAVKLLLGAGAKELPTPDGKLPSTIAQNGYVRAELGCGNLLRLRREEPQLDEASRSLIDSCSVLTLPALPDITEDDIADEAAAEGGGEGGSNAAAGGNDENSGEEGDETADGSPKRSKRLTRDEIEALVTRMYDQSIAKKQSWEKQNFDRIDGEDKQRYHSKVLAADELETSVARMYREELDKRTDRNATILSKYVRVKEDAKTLSSTDLEESAQRLWRVSVEKHASSLEALQEKYHPKPAANKMSKADMQASAKRLHDESMEHTVKSNGALFHKYCEEGQPPSRKLTQDEVKALGDRLCKPKGK